MNNVYSGQMSYNLDHLETTISNSNSETSNLMVDYVYFYVRLELEKVVSQNQVSNRINYI